MDEYREAQRQKWLQAQQAKQAASGSSASASGSAPAEGPQEAATSSRVQRDEEGALPSGASRPMRRLHILPIDSEPADVGSGGRLGLIAPELRRLRNSQEIVRVGTTLKGTSGHDFVVVGADPDETFLGPETDYFVDGDPIKRFSKVQFVCLWDYEQSSQLDSNQLFEQYIRPYFHSRPSENLVSVVSVSKVIKIFDREFQVFAVEPEAEIGVMDSNTLVFADWDTTPAFEKIHIIPFQDTLPAAYEYDIFNDYLKPYFTRHKHLLLEVNDQFTYQGVQFKVVCTLPDRTRGRIGSNTLIYCEGVLHPSLRNLLPPEFVEQLSSLPPGLQMLLLSTEAFANGYEDRLMEVQEMLNRRRGLSEDALARVDSFSWGERVMPPDSQSTCRVCLGEFVDGDEVKRLPCGHMFHSNCIQEWLHRSTDCPICKANVEANLAQASRPS
mmetsp:Transcript_23253/g.51028  ORF Transcript_23253/g.51028 Transcript_23253/m.51028 type:complete len:441 (+) Transcript_23253:179-1501(+)